MRRQDILKEKLLKIKASNFAISSNTDVYQMCLEMMEFIGVTDYVLRDELIYTIFSSIVETKLLNNDELKLILDRLLTKEFLFFGIESQGDSVFTRSFSILVIAEIMDRNSKNRFLSDTDFENILKSIFEYFSKEIDYRGYVPQKGWAHSIAHGSDCLLSLVTSPQFDDKYVIRILEIAKMIFTNEEYIFSCDEEERFITVIISLLKQKKLTLKELMEWITDFITHNKNSETPMEYNCKKNKKNFLSALYFRLHHIAIEDNVIREIKSYIFELISIYTFE